MKYDFVLPQFVIRDNCLAMTLIEEPQVTIEDELTLDMTKIVTSSSEIVIEKYVG